MSRGRPGQASPAPSALTFDHLGHQRGPCALPAHDSTASGRRGAGQRRVAREQPATERGGPRPHPQSFKNKSLKGRAPALGTASPRGRPPGPASPGSSKLLKRPELGGEGTTPSRPGCASPRLGDRGRSSVAPGPSSTETPLSRVGTSGQRVTEANTGSESDEEEDF